MKRFLIVLMVLGLIAGSAVTAEAKKTSPRAQRRTVVASYCNPFNVWPPVPFCGWNQIHVDTDAKEGFFTAEVADAHGQPLYVEVYRGSRSRFDDIHRGLGGDPGGMFVGSFCGETTKPIAFPAGTYLTFSVAIGVPPSNCPTGRFGTSGTLTATFSNLP